MRWRRILPIGFLLAATAGASAQQPPDPVQGRELSRQLCRGCHLVSPAQEGPVPDGIPSFMAIAARPGADAARIEAALIKPPHPLMPDPPLTRPQMRDVAAYILSLSP
jgi:mono/diheme cytochrome c family protein